MPSWDPLRTPKGAAGALGEAIEEFGRPRPYRPRKIRVPNLVGLTAQEAEDVLMRLGVKWNFKLLVDPPPPVMGRVVGQDPPPGSKVRRTKGAVTLTLIHEAEPSTAE